MVSIRAALLASRAADGWNGCDEEVLGCDVEALGCNVEALGCGAEGLGCGAKVLAWLPRIVDEASYRSTKVASLAP